MVRIMIPQRIQRKRTKGWKMPDNAVYVGRGSKWGNPFMVSKNTTLDDVLLNYTLYIYRKLTKGDLHLKELKGKNLACWCSLDKPCHADILLELANK